MDDLALLARSDLFSAFDEAALERLLTGARPLRCDRNQVIFSEGASADELFVVRSGRIAVGRRSPDGRESLVALMEAGDLFGEMPLFDQGERSASARALESSELLRLPYHLVREALDARPELLWDVVSLLAQRLRSTDSALADAVFLDVTGRTAKRLLELAGEADEFQLPITQEELAGLVGASRERVNKAIAAFIRLGWIDQIDRRYRIIERDRLAQRAR
ncbi:Crp/Fnr family transcriptional regulator [Acidiferrimicrobium sp. IK]|uniref:Crp/Fnr family transcriptional regulator n=1 Tax=Acidiferrimicrobium sp. IK TaxID=2871700 RepID=UPI0021CB3389|nr:Crp/Fnr family transcriptional regulator [Acidiferrimicrobium sp. IK]MCU4186969.1 Crp/Fnr family transcriptional regulator [Acidiferrimicrobium sp. IK]